MEKIFFPVFGKILNFQNFFEKLTKKTIFWRKFRKITIFWKKTGKKPSIKQPKISFLHLAHQKHKIS